MNSSFITSRPGPERLSIDFQVLVTTKMLRNKDFSCFKKFICCIYHANKRYNTNNCWHFNIYEHDNFCAQLS